MSERSRGGLGVVLDAVSENLKRTVLKVFKLYWKDLKDPEGLERVLERSRRTIGDDLDV